MAAPRPFKLSASLVGHQADVRSVASISSSVLVSGSRDQTARVWAKDNEGSSSFRVQSTLRGHHGFVNAVGWLGKGSTGFILTAGQDKLINAYEFDASSPSSLGPDVGEPSYCLVGHEDNVCAIDVSKGGMVVSGSWDKTAKVWRDWKLVATLKAHTLSVWAVLAVDEDKVLTGSADRDIHLWSVSSPTRPLATFKEHSDAVRGLTLLKGGQAFASCGNDGDINVYSLTTGSRTPLLKLHGHTSFVYSLATLASGELVSGGEDRTVRIWDPQAGTNLQTITHPAISVWSVVALPNGDIASGASDGVVRVFTRDPSRMANEEEISAYDRQVEGQALNTSQVGDVNKENLPGTEALSRPGTKEGQVIMVRNGSLVEAHQWSSSEESWQKVGEVVDAVGSGRKQLYEGREYDYVFDVDIQDGVPPLKLPYNVNENPYEAAERFLNRHELPLSHADQVVDFIHKNTAQIQVGQPEYSDPYTGASRYTAAGSGGSSGRPSAVHSSDSAYTGSGNVDPFTSSTPATPSPTASTLPQKSFLSFKQVNYSALRNKLNEFAQQIDGAGTRGVGAADVEAVAKAVEGAKGESGAKVDVGPLEVVLQTWPEGKRFPALDLLRLSNLCAPVLSSQFTLSSLALKASSWSAPWPAQGSLEAKERDTNSMLALRAISNMFIGGTGKREVVQKSAEIIDSLKGSHFKSLGKNGRIAMATIAFNYSASLVSTTKPQPSTAPKVLELLTEILRNEEGESEVVYRALVGLGNLLLSPSSGSLPVGAVQEAKELARDWGKTGKLGGEERIKQMTAEVASV